jgi:CPA2 family monovalent cation:H+ antiporter-2
MVTSTHDVSLVFIELGLVIVGLAVLARLASRWGFSAIPLYLLAGLAFGNGGLAPLRLSENFVRTGAEIGVLLLLFMLGLEYSGDELKESLRAGLPAGVVDFVLNFTPGLIAGLLFGWTKWAKFSSSKARSAGAEALPSPQPGGRIKLPAPILRA